MAVKTQEFNWPNINLLSFLLISGPEVSSIFCLLLLVPGPGNKKEKSEEINGPVPHKMK